MRNQLPTPSAVTLAVQCSVVLLFAFSLYLVLSTFETKKNYGSAITRLTEKKHDLEYATRQVDQYLKFVRNEPFFQRHTAEPQWETIDETWVDLSYNRLQERLTNLYRYDRPFVLDYFSAKLETGETDLPTGTSTTESLSANSSKKLVFHLQGYFLCPSN